MTGRNQNQNLPGKCALHLYLFITFDCFESPCSPQKKSILAKAGLCNLNETVASQTAIMVWKLHKARNPLGTSLFSNRTIIRPTPATKLFKYLE